MADIIPNLKEESKNLKENKQYVTKLILEHPVITLIIMVILILFVFIFCYITIHNIPFTKYKLSFISLEVLNPDENGTRIIDSAVSLYNEGKDWEINNTYGFGWALKSKDDFYGHIIIYFRPATENGLKTPIVFLDKEDITFSVNESIEIKGTVLTEDVSKGRYNICISLKDNLENSQYKFERCDNRQIVIN